MPMPSDSARKLKAQIELIEADFLTFDGDGIFVPTISEGYMVEALAARVKKAAGEIVEQEVVKSAPIAVGAAVATTAGALGIRYVIHVPVIELPGMKIGVENIRRATRAGLLAATHYQMERVAIPGIGYGEMGVPFDEAARAIIDEVKAYRATHPNAVVLMDTNPEMVDAFRQHLGG